MLNLNPDLNPSDLIDRDAIAAAHERHNSVQRRLDVARERLPQLEAAHLAARAEHQRSLSGESDADPVQSRKAMIDAADEFDLINEAVTTAIPAAIARSSNRLRTELEAAHRSAREAAERSFVASAKRIEKLRAELKDEIDIYQKTAVTAASFGSQTRTNLPMQMEGAIHWIKLPVETGNVVSHVMTQVRITLEGTN